MSKSTFITVSGSLPENIIVFNQEESIDLDKEIYYGTLRIRINEEEGQISQKDFWNAVMDQGLNNFQDNDPWAESFIEGLEDSEEIGILTKAVAKEAVRQGKSNWNYEEDPVYWEEESFYNQVEESLLDNYNNLPVLEVKGTGESIDLGELRGNKNLRTSSKSETYVNLPEGEVLVLIGLNVNGWLRPM